uniref:Reverse transcriptase domain-containing protein n=1 Tax=Amphimedon queenslandica TaxID=400682 RepID=A0A1X7U7W7_AMPQE
WKVHKITPIFKSGDRTSVVNYRPISLLSSVSKVLEKLIYDK